MMATEAQTRMALETAQAAQVVALQLEQNQGVIRELSSRFRKRPPRLIATCARGSSDAAATYAKYLMENELHVPVMSHAPSISSVYQSPINLADSLFLVISQSGRSPDLLTGMEWARQNGAFVLALINAPDSPAGQAADLVVPLGAGPEESIAATKSFIASLAALLQLTAHLADERRLLAACDRLPQDLEKGRLLDWTGAVATLSSGHNMLTVGRGLTLGIAQEAALKLKETAGKHAEGLSGAEMMHGPLALVESGLPVLMFIQNDAAASSLKRLARLLQDRHTLLFVAEEGPKAPYRLPVIPNLDPAAAPLVMIQSFYNLVNQIALKRGFDPDRPPLLKKVTETV